MDEVQSSDREDPRLRAEVLISMNVFCSEDLLLGLWQLLEEVDMRQEMLLVRLLIDMAPEGVESACERLTQHADQELRAMGYGVLALQSTRFGAKLLADAFEREPGLILKRGGKKKFAPYSFTTCMLAGIREFKDPKLDRMAMKALRRFAEGEDDLALLLELLRDQDPKVGKLGFVALASRVMGYIHRAAYEHVICQQPTPLLLEARTRDWLAKALTEAPEILEVVCEQGPPRLDGLTFIRARLLAVQEIGDDALTHICTELLSGHRRLPSLQIEEALYPKAALSDASRHLRRARTLGYLIALLMEYRPVLSALIEALSTGEEIEVSAVERLLMLSSEDGAFNVSTALIAHWHQLNPDNPEQASFWRWVDGLWHDDRHLHPQQALAAALSSPDETAGYAAEILGAVDDPQGKSLRKISSGELVEREDIVPLLDRSTWLSALRARLRMPTAHLHSQTIVNLARLGLSSLSSALRARRSACKEESPERGALDYALRAFEAARIASELPEIAVLPDLGLRLLDQRFERGARARDRIKDLPDTDPLTVALLSSPSVGLLQQRFWATDAHDLSLLRLIDKPWSLSLDAVIDLTDSKVLASRWLDGEGFVITPPPQLACRASRVRIWLHGPALDHPPRVTLRRPLRWTRQGRASRTRPPRRPPRPRPRLRLHRRPRGAP